MADKELFPPKKRLKSAVWDRFGYHKNDQGVIVEDGMPLCKTCGKKVSAKGANTTNMIHHLRDNHPALHAQIKVNAH